MVFVAVAVGRVNPQNNDAKRAALRAAFDKLVTAGDKNLYHLDNTHDILFASNELVNPTGLVQATLKEEEIAGRRTRNGKTQSYLVLKVSFSNSGWHSPQ